MKYLSLDLETTGLDPQRDQILMVGAVVEDTEHPEVLVEELPSFVCFVKHERYEGGAFALGLNGWILDIISGRAKNEKKIPIYNEWDSANAVIDGNWWVYQFDAWLEQLGMGKALLAGKNVGSFDYQFLPSRLQKRFLHRFLDPGSLFIDWTQDKPMGLDDLKKKFGINTPVVHDALEDARDVIKVLRTGTEDYKKQL
jgi:oligoribonuclease